MTVLRRGKIEEGASGGTLVSLWKSRLSASFWFIPALLTAGAIPLFYFTQALDQITYTYLTTLPIVYSGGASAARAVVSSVAGSLITVIATVFSLTVVTLQLASSSYTPRVLRTFSSDHGVQAVLGTYIATFLYSLLVLRVIRTPDSEGASLNPMISTTTTLVLALICVALLIYFIGHVVKIIQSSSIVGSAHQDTMEVVAQLDDLAGTPASDPADPTDRPELADLLAGEPLVARARRSGYVQHVDVGKLLQAMPARAGAGKTTVVELPFGPGSFVAAGLPVVRVWPARGSLSEDELLGAFVFDRERSFRQDFALGLLQLSDIALKGLSPGVNDPTTAMEAMDRTEAIFIALGEKAMPPRVREEETNGSKVLVKVGYYGFDDVVGLAFDQVRRAAFASGQVAVLARLLEMIGRAVDANELPERRRSLWACAFAVARLAPGQISDPEDAAGLILGAVRIGKSLMGSGVEVGPDLAKIADLTGDDRVRDAVDDALRGAAVR